MSIKDSAWLNEERQHSSSNTVEERKEEIFVLRCNSGVFATRYSIFLSQNVMRVTTFEVLSHQLRALLLVLCELGSSCQFKHFIIQCGRLCDDWLWPLSCKRKCHYLENCYFLLLRPLYFANSIFNDMQQVECNQDSICPSASMQFF